MEIQRLKYKDLEKVPKLKVNKNFKQDFAGSAPAPFIGRHGYPEVNIGVLSPQFLGNVSYYDSPKLWSKSKFSIGQIATLRYGLVNSRTRWKVKDLQKGGRFLDVLQEVGLAKDSAEIEVSLLKAPQLAAHGESEVMPFGPGASVKKARITSNTKVDSRVEKVVSDTDLKASEGILDLYKKGFEENALTKLISTGNLGLEKNRKLVPTRWSITAVDDTVGKKLIEEIKQFQLGSGHLAFFGGSWGNYYLLLFFPDNWSYELFETYLKLEKNPWSKNGYAYSTDYENYQGRKEYAEECAGGYYACRLPVLEKMKELKRQYSCLALRFITEEYNVPLGVWVCREASRKSLTTLPLNFSSPELLFKYAEEFIDKKFGFKTSFLLEHSRLLKEKKQQKKLTVYCN